MLLPRKLTLLARSPFGWPSPACWADNHTVSKCDGPRRGVSHECSRESSNRCWCCAACVVALGSYEVSGTRPNCLCSYIMQASIVRSGLRFAQGSAHYRLLVGRADPSRTPSARPVPQTIQAMTCIASPPQTHRSLGNLEPLRQRTNTLSRRTAQYNPRPGSQRVCDLLASQPCFQLGSIRFAHFPHPSLYAHAA